MQLARYNILDVLILPLFFLFPFNNVIGYAFRGNQGGFVSITLVYAFFFALVFGGYALIYPKSLKVNYAWLGGILLFILTAALSMAFSPFLAAIYSKGLIQIF